MGHCGPRRNSPIRLNLHRDVLHLHIILGLQNLLCLRLHASRFVRILCGYFWNFSTFQFSWYCWQWLYAWPSSALTSFSTPRTTGQTWKTFQYIWQVFLFQMAVDIVSSCRFHSWIRLLLLFLLFFLQNEVRPLKPVDIYSKTIPIRRMYGLFQTAFYFGYMAVFSLSLGILCGTIGYMGTR